MDSIKELYKIGHGPSSSHTMGPKKAAEQFIAQYPDAEKFIVELYGSLAATGKGHLTEEILKTTIGEKLQSIKWSPKIFLPKHPNALKFSAINENKTIGEWTAYSVGGGSIVDDSTEIGKRNIYPHTKLDDILNWCNENGKELWQYVESVEGEDIWEYLEKIWDVMSESIHRGLKTSGTLPGELKLPRKSQSFSRKAEDLSGPIKKRTLLFAYALAVSEENAAGGEIVTAPTCGGSGVLPAVLYSFKKNYKTDTIEIIHALATAGLIGNLVKYNASISGAEVGCQGEVGTACAMASAAATQLSGGTIYQIEYSAEMGIEHHLGLTCDPVAGLVQIPCIERNAFASERALSHNTYALLTDGKHRISFDEVVETMYKTGLDLPSFYKETSMGGLAMFKGIAKK